MLRVERLSDPPAAAPRRRSEAEALLAAAASGLAQQTPAWGDVIAGLGVDEPVALGCWEDAPAGEPRLVGLLPGFRFAGPLGAIQVSMAQAGALGGVVCARDADRREVYRALVAAFLAQARESGCALATLLSDPFVSDLELCRELMEPDFELENTLLALDLEHDVAPDGSFPRASSGLRRNLARARDGAIRIDEEQSEANLAEWIAIHEERHRELGATPLPRALFRGALAEMVPRDLARFFFVRRVAGGEMVAGGLYLKHGAVVDAFMPSLRSRFAGLRPNHLLAATSIAWARAAGARWYNWQASPPDGGVKRFKQQWGGREHAYGFLTRVTGPAERLLAADPATLAAGYPWHFVLPYDRAPDGAGSGGRTGRRDSAWRALEAARR